MALQRCSRSILGKVLASPWAGSAAVASRAWAPAGVRQPFATDVASVSGVPDDAFGKRVLIFSPARSAGQQGRGKTIEGDAYPWHISFPTQSKWENPLMGWTSTADSHENVARAANGLSFPSKEDAIAYCKKMGYEFDVKEPKERSTIRTPRFATYGDNYSTRRAGVPQGGMRSELKK